MNYSYQNVKLKNIIEPIRDCTGIPIDLSDETMIRRKRLVLERMAAKGLDALVIYADMEHGSNFEYLVGFLPRFEEALLVLHRDGKAYMMLGNENLNKCGKSRISAVPILCSFLSLPNQPMQDNESLKDVLAKTDIAGKKVGIVGWKNFTSKYENNTKLFDMPAYLLNTIMALCGMDNLSNATDIFIGGDGVRTHCNANEIAHYEFASSLSGDCMLDAMDSLREGISEMEIADKLVRYGQRTSIITICAFGERFLKANMYPTDRKLKRGVPIALTVGYKGGANSRSCVAVSNAEEMPHDQRDYIEKVVAPYFTAITAWLENIHDGMMGGEMYELINTVLPKTAYGWRLNPGHTTSDEEWMSSPIFEGSKEMIHSGTIFQTDIILSKPGYYGTSGESNCVIANAALRKEIEIQYPEMYRRMMARREYIIRVQGINLHEDVLPMCSVMTYMRPFALSHDAVVIEK